MIMNCFITLLDIVETIFQKAVLGVFAVVLRILVIKSRCISSPLFSINV